MEREFSAGGAVVSRRQHEWWLAAIEPQGRAASRGKPVLALPKGLIDSGEKAADTAVREVAEETGLQATLITKLADIKYVYMRSWGDRQRVFKVVSFFLLRYRSGRIDDVSEEMRIEVKRAAWIKLGEAPRLLAYKGERDVAQRALDYLAAHPELEEDTDADH